MKVIIFSSLPPPIGGVTRSVENLLRALHGKSVYTTVITNYSSIKGLFKRYDIAHIHYSKSWKRLLGIILGKIVSKKVIFTLHGNKYNNDYLNNISSKFADGVILLNTTTEMKYKNKFKNTATIGSLFLEGVKETNAVDQKYIQKVEKKIYLLMYAFNRSYQDSKDIYGGDFILDNLSNLDNKYVVVFLDFKGAYRDEVKHINSDALIYLDYEVDFLSLLSEIDIYVRPTTTDGSSVAVQEALMLGKKVLASDVVERPSEVTLYISDDFVDFKDKLENIKDIKGFIPNSIDKYLEFCNTLLKN